MDIKKILDYHSEKKGKTGTLIKTSINNREELSVAYTPGVAQVCLEIARDKKKVDEYTARKNTVAIVSDGTAVLGLGSIGPEAALPVMEGKAAIFKKFADIDAVPLCIPSHLTADQIVEFIKNLTPTFGGINLEDVAAPKCFEISKKMEGSGIVYFHDDQYGTAVVVLAALINSLKLAGKKLEEIKIVINGAGAAGLAISDLLIKAGLKNLILCDINGVIHEGNYEYDHRKQFLKYNLEGVKGDLKQALIGADVFIGVSSGGILESDDIKVMNEKAIVFAMANPNPEILPDAAKKGGAYIVATGRSDFDNQVNNLLGFPGIFKGAFECNADRIDIKMCLDAAYGLSEVLSDDEISINNILPDVFDERVCQKVSESISKKYTK